MSQIFSSLPATSPAVSPDAPSPHATTKRGAYKLLEAWRGLAALWVVMLHAASVLTRDTPRLRAFPLYGFSLHGHWGVQIFFVVSGYCIANAAALSLTRGQGIMHFLKARARRVYPPYWASLLFFALASLGASWLVKSGKLHKSNSAEVNLLHQGPLFFLSNLSLTQVGLHQASLSIVSWTLCYEIAFYVAAAALLLLARRQNERMMLHALHVLTAIALLWLLIAPAKVPFPLDLWPQFGLGVLVYDLLQHRDEIAPKLWALLLGAQMIAFIVARDVLMGYTRQPSRRMFLVSLIFAASLILLHPFDARLSHLRAVKALSFVGAFSYSLYLMHFLVIGMLSQVFKKLPLPASLHLLLFVLFIVASLLVTFVFHLLFERPFMNARRKTVTGAALSA